MEASLADDEQTAGVVSALTAVKTPLTSVTFLVAGHECSFGTLWDQSLDPSTVSLAQLRQKMAVFAVESGKEFGDAGFAFARKRGDMSSPLHEAQEQHTTLSQVCTADCNDSCFVWLMHPFSSKRDPVRKPATRKGLTEGTTAATNKKRASDGESAPPKKSAKKAGGRAKASGKAPAKPKATAQQPDQVVAFNGGSFPLVYNNPRLDRSVQHFILQSAMEQQQLTCEQIDELVDREGYLNSNGDSWGASAGPRMYMYIRDRAWARVVVRACACVVALRGPRVRRVQTGAS